MNGRPGNRWIRYFERRHRDRLRYRKREGLSKARASGLSKESVAGFYEKYKKLVKDKKLDHKPWCLFNCDEFGCSAEKNDQMVYAAASRKNNYSLKAMGTKAMFTVLACCNGVGQFLPPFTVYKAKHIYESWTKGGVDGAHYGCSDSRWMEAITLRHGLLKYLYHTLLNLQGMTIKF